MRIALLADVHANLEALLAVLRKIDSSRVDEIWCIGDIVGYGADPLACLQLIRQNCSLVVQGNHDIAATLPHTPDNFTLNAHIAADWTRRQLNEESLAWLAALPVEQKRHRLHVFHSSLIYTNAYITSREEAQANIRFMEQYPNTLGGFFGHTHIPCFIQEPGLFRNMHTATHILVDPEKPFLANPGSTGQARNRSPKAWFAVLDTQDSFLQFFAVSYEIGIAQRKILEAGLPAFLAERLEFGI
ncbi:MAG: metallophosphatase family protein [Spirochaetota bacterium]|jgi:predicted phosphodiesterase|nr:metallophosphatase family protein [Spirochaetota bacterium]